MIFRVYVNLPEGRCHNSYRGPIYQQTWGWNFHGTHFTSTAAPSSLYIYIPKTWREYTMKSPFFIVKYVNSAFLRVKYPLVITNIAKWKITMLFLWVNPLFPCYFLWVNPLFLWVNPLFLWVNPRTFYGHEITFFPWLVGPQEEAIRLFTVESTAAIITSLVTWQPWKTSCKRWRFLFFLNYIYRDDSLYVF